MEVPLHPKVERQETLTIRTLITDDHKVVRQGLHGSLELDSEIEVVGEAANGEEAVAMVRTRPAWC